MRPVFLTGILGNSSFPFCCPPQHGHIYMMNVLFTLFDLDFGPGMNIYTKIWFNEVCVPSIETWVSMLTDPKPDLVSMSWYCCCLLHFVECCCWLDMNKRIGSSTRTLCVLLNVSFAPFIPYPIAWWTLNICCIFWITMSIQYYFTLENWSFPWLLPLHHLDEDDLLLTMQSRSCSLSWILEYDK